MNPRFDDTNAITLGSGATGVSNRSLRVGDIVGGSYRLKSLLGRGGMGYVFCAEHIMIKRDYALKMLAPEQLNDESRRRFEVEGKAIANMEHPNIVKVYNMGLDNGDCPFYVMDLLDGQALSHYIADGTKFSFRRWVQIFIQIAAGLEYAHSKGIVHRDIKPSNIVLLESAQDVTVKIVDFGIAKLLPSNNLRAQSQTATGAVFGSPYYMSPEQSLGTNVDLRSDIYSLGCTWYEALCGHPPYMGENALKTIMLHQNAEIPSIVMDCPTRDWPESVDDLLAKMIAKRPENRYQSMQQVIHDLERLKAGKNIGKVEAVGNRSQTLSALPKNVNPESTARAKIAITAVTAVALLAVASAGTVLWMQNHPKVTDVDKILNKENKNINLTPGIEEDGSVDGLRMKIRSSDPNDSAQLLLETTQSKRPEQNKVDLPPAKKAFAACRTIESHIAKDSRGKAVRRFVFPSWSMGRVMTSALDSKDAKNTVDISPTMPAGLEIGDDESRMVLLCPEVVAKIKPDEFVFLRVIGHSVSGVTSSMSGMPSETNALIPILQSASRWPKLERIWLDDIGTPVEVMKVLDKSKGLRYLQLHHPIINTRDVLKSAFIGRLNRLELVTMYDVNVIIPVLAASTNLQTLELIGCDITAQDLAVLARSKSLQNLVMSEYKYTTLVPAMAKMSSLKSIKLDGGILTPYQMRTITACPNITELILNRKSYDDVEVARCMHQERKIKFIY